MRNGAMVCAVLLALAVLGRIEALPVSSSFLGGDASDYDDSYEDDYDVVFDQRQNGTANVRVSVDGVLLALPGPEIPSSASLAGATLLELFASQLAAGGGGDGGELEDDVSDELYAGSVEAGSGGTNTSSGSSTLPGLRPATSTTTSSPTTAAAAATTPAPAPAPSPPPPPSPLGGLSSDFAFETLPVSLFGQGLNFLFNTRRTGEVPFRVSPSGAEPAPQPVPLLITKVEKAGPHRHDSSEESRELAEPQRADAPEPSGKRKRKHKRKYKVRMASMLRPLLKRTALRH